MRSYWLSFCDTSRPDGQQFLGACVVTAGCVGAAPMKAWRQGCNPGGEVSIVEIPITLEPLITERWRRRLLTKKECHELDAHLAEAAPYPAPMGQA